MSANAEEVAGIPAKDLEFGDSFKRVSADYQGYTLCRIEPEDEFETPRQGYILAYNIHANRKIIDVREDEIVYPITEANRTAW